MNKLNLIEINRLFEINNIHMEINKFQLLTGTTNGVVYRLESGDGNKYVLKFDHPNEIELTVRLLNTYPHSKLFPNIICVANDQSYMIYSFIEGTTHFNRGSKKNWLKILVVELLNKYTTIEAEHVWGRLGYSRQSWKIFNETSIEEARNNIGNVLTTDDYNFVCTQASKLFNEEPPEQYLLHGDTGVHNFVFNQSTLVGVIDPSPMIGPLIYDFVYAFCSSPDDINLDTLYTAFDYLEKGKVDRTRLLDEVAIQLYCRIGLSIKHHPNDLQEYLQAWKYWREICK